MKGTFMLNLTFFCLLKQHSGDFRVAGNASQPAKQAIKHACWLEPNHLYSKHSVELIKESFIFQTQIKIYPLDLRDNITNILMEYHRRMEKSETQSKTHFEKFDSLPTSDDGDGEYQPELRPLAS